MTPPDERLAWALIVTFATILFFVAMGLYAELDMSLFIFPIVGLGAGLGHWTYEKIP